MEVAPPYKALRLLAYLQFFKGKQVLSIMVSCLPQVLVPDVAEGGREIPAGVGARSQYPQSFRDIPMIQYIRV